MSADVPDEKRVWPSAGTERTCSVKAVIFALKYDLNITYSPTFFLEGARDCLLFSLVLWFVVAFGFSE